MNTHTDHVSPEHSEHEADAHVVTLATKAEPLLEQARNHRSRRASETLVGGPVMRATLIALAEGSELGEHDAPPAATLLAVTGHVTLKGAARQWPLGPGELVAIPQERHSLTAETDAVVLLTVALHGGTAPSDPGIAG